MKVTGKVILELSPMEVEKLLEVLVDEDKEEGFRFLKECLGRKLEEKLRPHCVPIFEASYAANKERLTYQGVKGEERAQRCSRGTQCSKGCSLEQNRKGLQTTSNEVASRQEPAESPSRRAIQGNPMGISKNERGEVRSDEFRARNPSCRL